MSMTMDQMCAEMKAAALEMNTHDEFGALHIFVADGNCEDEHLEFCLAQPNITEREKEFALRMLTEMTEEMRAGVFALSMCRDAEPSPSPPPVV